MLNWEIAGDIAAKAFGKQEQKSFQKWGGAFERLDLRWKSKPKKHGGFQVPAPTQEEDRVTLIAEQCFRSSALPFFSTLSVGCYYNAAEIYRCSRGLKISWKDSFGLVWIIICRSGIILLVLHIWNNWNIIFTENKTNQVNMRKHIFPNLIITF